MKRIFKPRERKRERDPTALRSCQSKQFRVWRKRGKKRKSTPPRSLRRSEEDKVFGKKVPRKSLSFREKFSVRKGTVGLPKSIRISDLPLPGKQSERPKPAFSMKNRSKRKECPLPQRISDRPAFSCARAREAFRVEFFSLSERRDLAEREIFKRRVPKEFEGKKNAYLLCLGSSLSRYRWCPKTPPLR